MAFEDEAQEQELMRWELNNRSRPEPVRFIPGMAGYGPAQCNECGEDMPDKRREHGFTICVFCQSAIELKGKHHTRH